MDSRAASYAALRLVTRGIHIPPFHYPKIVASLVMTLKLTTFISGIALILTFHSRCVRGAGGLVTRI